jgi:hypothetical protein
VRQKDAVADAGAVLNQRFIDARGLSSVFSLHGRPATPQMVAVAEETHAPLLEPRQDVAEPTGVLTPRSTLLAMNHHGAAAPATIAHPAPALVEDSHGAPHSVVPHGTTHEAAHEVATAHHAGKPTAHHAGKPAAHHADVLEEQPITVDAEKRGQVTMKDASVLALRSNSNLNKYGHPDGHVIAVIPNHALVTIHKGHSEGGFFHVTYNGHTGWAHSSCISIVSGDTHAPAHKPDHSTERIPET